MKNYLDAVKQHCNTLEKTGKIAAIKLSYPSFEMNQNDFRRAVLDYTTERVKIGLLTGDYGNKKFSDSINYESLFNTEERVEAKLDNTNDLGNKMYLDKILPTVMNKDINLEAREINRNSIKDVCVRNMQHILMDLEDIRVNSLPYERTNQSTYLVKKDKFVASLIMLKEQLPHVCSAVENMMNSSGYKALVEDINNLKQAPSIAVIQHIMETDKKFAAEKYPKEVRSLNEGTAIKFVA